ncbi:MAG: hypothetical protein RBR42_08005 [Desulfomicrobium sp.]|jgi:hypothetical protein|nr:hypothetical protein [Desulfomicrobium sp.]NLV97195.1 hypothetical protein [Desulfovibrionales bacterium]
MRYYYLPLLLSLFLAYGLSTSFPDTAQAAAPLFLEHTYEAEDDIAWNWAAVSSAENKITFIASPCSADVYLHAKDGYWEGVLGQTEGVACSSLDAAFTSGQVIMHIVPIQNNDQNEILAFEVRIPQAIRKYVQNLNTSMFVEDFFTREEIRYFLPGANISLSPVLTLTDPQTSNSVPLYNTGGDPSGKNFLLYYNEKFDYTCWIPTAFTQVVLLPDNEDGLIVAAVDAQAQLRATGGYVDFLDGGLKGDFERTKNSITKNNLIYEDYTQDEWKTYWELRWQDSDKIVLRKMILNGDYYCDLEISYPAAQQEKYSSVADIIAHNFNREIEDF